MPRTYFVYILASESRELYVGVTNDLPRRLSEHRANLDLEGYAAKHNATRLVYAEATGDVRAAIRREKQIKTWTRVRKLEPIETINPAWKDFAEGW
jgi:putative endonuclease